MGNKFWTGIIITMFISLVIAIVVGGTKMVKQTNQIKTECVKTTLIVIGNKGHATPVYDCAKKDIHGSI